MKKLFIFIFCFTLVFCFNACKQKGKEQGGIADSGKVDIKIRRFDKLLFESDTNNLQTSLMKHEQEYRFLLNAPLTDTAYVAEINRFVGEHLCKELYTNVRAKYSNLGWLESSLTDAFLRTKEFFPNDSTPVVYALISANFDYFSRVIATPEFMAISLEMYTMKNYQKYGYFQLANYMVNFLDSANIVPDCMYAWGLNLLPKEAPEKTLLDKMVLQGKVLYYLNEVLPNVPAELRIRYTSEQLQWCKDNEELIWGYLIQNKLLYETEFTKIRSMVNEGPGTPNFQGSPSRLGDYMGWQIVSKYMANNKSSANDLFQNTNSQEILTKSGYKPKRK